MTTRLLLKISIILLTTTLFSSCQNHQEKNERPPSANAVSVKDFLGRTVQLDNPPQRIISLAPNMTELIYALGAEDRLIGVTTYCNYPEDAQAKPIMGGFSDHDLNLEAILAAKPDLVLATPTKITPMVEKFGALGIPLYGFNPPDVMAMLGGFKQIGYLIGEPSRADSLVKQMKLDIELLQKARIHQQPRSVFIEISSSPLMSVTSETFVGQMLMIAGGVNICGGLSGSYVQVNAELVLEKDPDVIIIAHPGISIDELKNRPGWEQLQAFQHNAIVTDMDQDLIFRAGPRFMEGARAFYRALYQNPSQPEESD